jgi:hypothetical protein
LSDWHGKQVDTKRPVTIERSELAVTPVRAGGRGEGAFNSHFFV